MSRAAPARPSLASLALLLGGLGACAARTSAEPHWSAARGAAGPTCDGGPCPEAAVARECDPRRDLACSTERLPLVVQLEWQGPADVDLVLRGPNGERLDHAHDEAFGGFYVQDTRGACAGSAVLGVERVVFLEAPRVPLTAVGELFDTCGGGAVRVAFTVFRYGRAAYRSEHNLVPGRVERFSEALPP